MTAEIEAINNQINMLEAKMCHLEGQLNGLRFGRDLLVKEAARLMASAESDALVAAEQAAEDAVEIRHEGITAEVVNGPGEVMLGAETTNA